VLTLYLEFDKEIVDNATAKEYEIMHKVLYDRWTRENSKDLGLLDYHYIRGRAGYDSKGKVDRGKTAKLKKEAQRIRNVLTKPLTSKKERANISKEEFVNVEKYFEKLKQDGKLAGL
jgi:hypothetical protein